MRFTGSLLPYHQGLWRLLLLAIAPGALITACAPRAPQNTNASGDVGDAPTMAHTSPKAVEPKLPARATVGAIRWDGWFENGDFERFLQPEAWAARHPFFSERRPDGSVRVVSDSAAVMEQELSLASGAGLDYWAFCYYHPSWEKAWSYNNGLRRYLEAKDRRSVRFCLLLQACWLGPREEWAKTADDFVAHFRHPDYLKVQGNRPLLYMFYLEHLPPTFGSVAEARQALQLLAEKSQAAGLGTPYLVTQVFSVDAGREAIAQYGFDAIGAYTMPGDGGHIERPYADLAAANRAFWEAGREAGSEVVPIVNAGWDARPRLVDEKLKINYEHGPWYLQPTPTAFAEHLKSALDWAAAYPQTVPANTILIYAWNEIDEGGWLVPTLAEGDARLRAMENILR